MIWTRGRLVPDDRPLVDPRDRVFEHGLGLFETLRTWQGRPALLDRHRARMQRSADALGLPLDPADLPDAQAVDELIAAESIAGDARLRVVATGGDPASGRASSVWLRATPWDQPTGPAESRPARLGGSRLVDPLDPLAGHKTLNYWRKQLDFRDAQRAGCDELIYRDPAGRFWESGRANLFFVEGDRLVTPGPDGPFLPGVMRALVIELAGPLGLAVDERPVDRAIVERATEVFLTNATRGIVAVGGIEAAGGLVDLDYPAPGPLTLRIWAGVEAWLARGGDPR